MQEIDQVGMARPVTKLSAMVTDPRRIPDTVAHALRVALAGRRGPVHLTVPVDVQQAPIDASDIAYLPLRPPPPTRANQTAVREAVELMAGARRPVAIAGTATAMSANTANQESIGRLHEQPAMCMSAS